MENIGSSNLKRREALAGLASLALVPACQRPAATASSVSAAAPGTPGAAGTPAPAFQQPSKVASGSAMPVIFMAHGYPLWSVNEERIADFRNWAGALPRPKAVLVVSAHWESAPTTLGATTTVSLVYDFYGFPEQFYRVKYPAPGAPALASRVEGLLGAAGLPSARDEKRGLDHGAYVPLQMMYPDADVPILQVSLPTMDPKVLLAVGRALAPLRQEGILIVGSGFLTHNLRRFDPRPDAPTPQWAGEFDEWATQAFGKRDVDAVMQYRTRAPGVEIALPTHEHFVPAVVALGASLDKSEAVSFPIVGWEAGSLTRRSLQFG